MEKVGFKWFSLILLLFCFSIYGLFSLSDNKEDFEQVAIKIAGEVFIKNNAYEILRVLSDEIGPRLTGSESAHKAEAFCLDLFKQYGLSNAHMEQFEAAGWLPGEVRAKALEPFVKQLVVDSMGLSLNTYPNRPDIPQGNDRICPSINPHITMIEIMELGLILLLKIKKNSLSI